MVEGKKQRRKYDKEFKIQAVKFFLESGKTVEEVADLGIYHGNLSWWKRAYRRDAEGAFLGMGKMKPEDEELRRLKRENEGSRKEREILNKALAIFSRLQR